MGTGAMGSEGDRGASGLPGEAGGDGQSAGDGVANFGGLMVSRSTIHTNEALGQQEAPGTVAVSPISMVKW